MMLGPTVDDVYDRALTKIMAMRERHFREDVMRDYTDPDPTSYMCWRCRQRHGVLTKTGQRHLPADRRNE